MYGPDYIVDIPGLKKVAPTPGEQTEQSSFKGRPWLAVKWRCCRVYSRIYRNAEATHYAGRCPRCGKSVKASVGADGTSSRFFTAE